MVHLFETDIIDRFTVLDSDGSLVEGETFTSDASHDPEGETIDWSVTELGSGLYEVHYHLGDAGHYYLRLVGDTTQRVYEFPFRTDSPIPGESVAEYFTVLDDDGAYYSDAVLSVDASYDAAGDPFAIDLANLGNGLYSATFVPSGAGVHTYRIHADLSAIDDDDQYFEFEVLVVADTSTAVVSPIIITSGSTLDDLVRGVAMACRDFFRLRATEDATDSFTWPDRGHLAGKPPKMFKGASLFVDSSVTEANVGKIVNVVDSVSGALKFEPALPGAVRAGDTAYLTNLESTGFVWDQYQEEINAQIRGIFPESVATAVWTFTDVFDGDSPYLTPPAEFTHIYQIDYPTGIYAEHYVAIPSFHEIGEGDGWWWDEPYDRIVLGGDYRTAASGQYVTIRGFGRWPILEEPGDVTGIAYEWLRYAAAGTLVWSLRDTRRQAEAANNVNRADALRIKPATKFPPNTVRIR